MYLPRFKTSVREGLALQMSRTISIDLRLDIGAVSETVEVTAAAPVLDTSPLEAGALIDNDQLMDMPVLGNNPTLLTKFMPGIQTDGINNYLGLHSIAGGSAYNNAGGVGGNEWFDMLNVFNRYQFDNPNTDPTNTNFGIVQQRTAATNRVLQFQGRIQF